MPRSAFLLSFVWAAQERKEFLTPRRLQRIGLTELRKNHDQLQRRYTTLQTELKESQRQSERLNSEIGSLKSTFLDRDRRLQAQEEELASKQKLLLETDAQGKRMKLLLDRERVSSMLCRWRGGSGSITHSSPCVPLCWIQAERRREVEQLRRSNEDASGKITVLKDKVLTMSDLVLSWQELVENQQVSLGWMLFH